MKIKVYQIPYGTEVFRERAFDNLETLEHRFGVARIDLMRAYAVAWEGELDTQDLERAYQILNTRPLPDGYTCRSLSTSDVVETPEGMFFCDSVGFKKLAQCPRCRMWYADAPALSRRDNETDICPKCGLDEALEDMAAARGEGRA